MGPARRRHIACSTYMRFNYSVLNYSTVHLNKERKVFWNPWFVSCQRRLKVDERTFLMWVRCYFQGPNALWLKSSCLLFLHWYKMAYFLINILFSGCQSCIWKVQNAEFGCLLICWFSNFPVSCCRYKYLTISLCPVPLRLPSGECVPSSVYPPQAQLKF